jgi:hypothetical protein
MVATFGIPYSLALTLARWVYKWTEHSVKTLGIKGIDQLDFSDAGPQWNRLSVKQRHV